MRKCKRKIANILFVVLIIIMVLMIGYFIRNGIVLVGSDF